MHVFLFRLLPPLSRDLHTVDDGVLSHLSTELGKRDWDVLVAHFLGVDHVGHTFGPASQAMEDKLDQMNAALRHVQWWSRYIPYRTAVPCSVRVPIHRALVGYLY